MKKLMSKVIMFTFTLTVFCLMFVGCKRNEDLFVIAQTANGTSLVSTTIKSESVTHLKIPDGVTHIASCAFLNNVLSLVEITIPSSVEIIDDEAFAGCIHLEKINFGASLYLSKLKFIGKQAFSDCISLRGLTLTQNGLYIDNNAFYKCNDLVLTITGYSLSFMHPSTVSSIKALIVPDTAFIINYLKFDNIYSNVFIQTNVEGDFIIDTENKNRLKLYIGNAENVEIPGHFTKIANRAFENSKIKSVYIPRTVTAIEARAFCNCKFLSSVIFEAGSGLEKISYNAFSNCYLLKEIDLPNLLQWWPPSSGGGTDFDDPILLFIDTQITLYLGFQPDYYFAFIPDETRTYIIYSTGYVDTTVRLYSGTYSYLGSDDDGGVGANFRLECTLTADEIYFFVIGRWNNDSQGSTTVICI